MRCGRGKNNFQKQIILESAIDLISKFIFGLIQIDEFFKQIHQLTKLIIKNYRRKFLESLKLYVQSVKETNIPQELVEEINLVLLSLHNFIEYSEFNIDDYYRKYVKNTFRIFIQFYNKIFFDTYE